LVEASYAVEVIETASVIRPTAPVESFRGIGLASCAVSPNVSWRIQMKRAGSVPWIMVVASLVFLPAVWAQDNAQATPAAKPDETFTNSDSQNIRAYIELLRSDVRQQKAEMVGAVMQLSAADAAKFWPIYNEYDAQLSKLNDLRVANIQEYATSYSQLTDAKADELIQKALAYRKQRSELLATYYTRVREALGGITAARFIQVEDQLLLIIDLQIDSGLPLAQ
jgi:hypothetical protein